ncbi:putative LysR family transcriptional regulator [Frankia canadensis]|uniref:Putative LysR family transcriptional regulator n=1 Tax=Frankia canadensis TaxID=1836972 RepID=A0A2I2KL66_9ACTN|nr:LysR family transcriptional regulator [Frankia canadensis]SNQ46403.1 putative LysR family transcriptional regulator [Frankia canadensis]SOU53693.1 putative LysR family transcriptional regulator [Frankia canadensis]
MELRQLEYFIAVAEEANFTRAAQRVRISQSGVSAQVRVLEHELGALLIDRSGRSATLTPAGVAALEHARAALAAVGAVRAAVDEVNGLIRGRIVVGMVASCTFEPLFDALASFHAEHPGIEITLTEDSSDRLLDQVRAGSLGLALVGTPADAPLLSGAGTMSGAGALPEPRAVSGPRAMPVVAEPLVAAVAPAHPLAVRSSLRVGDLVPYPIACLPTGTGVRAVFDRACAAAGERPRVTLEAAAPTAVAELAARGLGVAVLSASMVDDQPDRLRSMPIEDVPTLAALALVWGDTHDPALRVLIRHCHRRFAQPTSTARPTSR